MWFFLVIAILNLVGAAANAFWITDPVNAAVSVMCLICAAVNYWCYRDSKDFFAKNARKYPQ